MISPGLTWGLLIGQSCPLHDLPWRGEHVLGPDHHHHHPHHVHHDSPEHHEGGDAAQGPDVRPRAIAHPGTGPERPDQLWCQEGECSHQGARVHFS